MIIGIPKEIVIGEHRAAATPESVKFLIKAGFSSVVESEAGRLADFVNRDYEQAGSTIIKDTASLYKESDIILKVQTPIFNEELKQHEADFLREGSVLVGLLNPVGNLKTIQKLADKKVTSFSVDLMPRITRAQKLDALSSQANVAGYKAVLEAAGASGKVFPMMITAAGTVQPARALVLGAGVAGLQAIAMARRLGAVVEAFDTRPAVKEQVESLGAAFIEIPLEEADAEDQGGYAKEISAESHKKEIEVISQHAQRADIIITTALIPNKPAPLLIAKDTVAKMKPGTVIVDLAASQGGNCELSEPDKMVITNDVTIIGYTNLPSLMAEEASLLYARNLMYFLKEITKDGKMNIDLENPVVKETLVTHQGEVVNEQVKKMLKGNK